MLAEPSGYFWVSLFMIGIRDISVDMLDYFEDDEDMEDVLVTRAEFIEKTSSISTHFYRALQEMMHVRLSSFLACVVHQDPDRWSGRHIIASWREHAHRRFSSATSASGHGGVAGLAATHTDH